MVREKLSQGGGLIPLTAGEDHVPERVEKEIKLCFIQSIPTSATIV